MPLNKIAAAYLAYFAYIDDGLDVVHASDFATFLQHATQPGANGPWTLTWGPAVNDGVLAYIARGADGTYALAFRGTDTDTNVIGSFQNFFDDLSAFSFVPWNYPQNAGRGNISAGTNDALALAIGLTDPVTDFALLDYLRVVAAKANGPLQLIVTGHSLGGALTVVASAWIADQLPKVGNGSVTVWPHSFAAPTVWDAHFAAWFGAAFRYYAAVNAYDIVPMAWNNVNPGILSTFPDGGPSLLLSDPVLYAAIGAVSTKIPQSEYVSIVPSDADVFNGTIELGVSWTREAGAQHSMETTYFPHATGMPAPPLPNTTTAGISPTRAATA